ncbi:MAG: multidrug efflux system outer membrane protein [Phenylobacterium sp.]|jgi:multidrug efflux system outer membrane protein
MGNRLKRLFTATAFSTVLVACSTIDQQPAERDGSIQNIQLPDSAATRWQQGAPIQQHWLGSFNDAHLQALVQQSVANNHQLKQQAYSVEMKKQQLISTGSVLWPSLDLAVNNSRRKTTNPDRYSTSSSANLTLAYEVDIWGKLSANERNANLNYLAEQASFSQAKQQLVADVVTAWYGVIEAQQLLALYQQRTTNSQQNLEIIESGYRQGLNSALDVYLTRNELNTERSRVAQQQDTLAQLVRRLERLVGDYPGAELAVNGTLPLLDSAIPVGLPAQLIRRKPALQASWYQLLASDAALAYSHKQRFPSLKLTASASDSGTDLTDLLSPSALAWSLIGNITAPLFDGGRRKANEEQARLAVKQGEQGYLNSLYDAFATVENALSKEQSLKQRYQAMIKAQENAIAAQSLSFEQYKNGLVSYTTVLDAQSRSYDAQSTVIQLKNQLIANRVTLHVALGGDFQQHPLQQQQQQEAK